MTFPENKEALISAFEKLLTTDGLIASWPGKKNRTALEQMLQAYSWTRLLEAEKEAGSGGGEVRYSEQEMTVLMRSKLAHSLSGADIILLRRELFEQKLLGREDDGSAYWINKEGNPANPWTMDTAWTKDLKGKVAAAGRDAPSSNFWEGAKAEVQDPYPEQVDA